MSPAKYTSGGAAVGNGVAATFSGSPAEGLWVKTAGVVEIKDSQNNTVNFGTVAASVIVPVKCLGVTANCAATVVPLR